MNIQKLKELLANWKEKLCPKKVTINDNPQEARERLTAWQLDREIRNAENKDRFRFLTTALLLGMPMLSKL